MQLLYVTLTGADESISPEYLVSLSASHPFVELAILFSQSKSGTKPRYPGHDWVVSLCETVRGNKVNLAAHLCGKWVDDFLNGHFTFSYHKLFPEAFGRIQLNLGRERLRAAISSPTFLALAKAVGRDVPLIFGGNYDGLDLSGDFFWENNLLPLFDASGGRGVQRDEWPKPFVCSNGVRLAHGYAGGLGPGSVREQLPRIAAAAGDYPVWIDMETRLRYKPVEQVVRFDTAGRFCDDFFDIAKCRVVLDEAKDAVVEQT